MIRRHELGQAGAEVILGGVVLLIGLVIVLGSLWSVLDAKLAATNAARTAIQTFVEQDDAASGEAALVASLQRSLDDRFPDRWRVAIANDAFVRCAPATVSLSVEVPLLAVPFLGSFGGVKTVHATHRSLIDPYRSRVPGEADC